MRNRIKSELAKLPARLPKGVTQALRFVGGGKLYSAVGDRISNTLLVEINYEGVQFTIESDLGNPSRTIERRGVYEPAVTKKLATALGSDEYFVNVGSSFGYFPLLASHVTRPELVYGIEPNPETREIFERNNRRVVDGKITIESYLVGAENDHTEATLTVYSGLPAGESEEVTVETRQITLDGFVSHFDISLDFILTDIDGEEYAMLKGAKKTLTEDSPKLLIEVHPELLIENHDIRAIEVLQLLNARDYSCWTADTYDRDDPDWKSLDGEIPDEPFHVFAKPDV